MVANGGMTYTEDVSHFFIWVIAKSPLLLGNDVTAMDADTLALLTSAEVLAISGDELGVAGDLVNRTCLVAGVETACSGGGGGGGGGTYPTISAVSCASAGDKALKSQVFNISAAPYANASGSDVVVSQFNGQCVALWDCAAPVVFYDCTASSSSCSGLGMQHFEWASVPLPGGGGRFQLRSIFSGQCLTVGSGNELATVNCSAGGEGWTLSALGQLVEDASGLCADVDPVSGEPVDTWATNLAGGERAALLLNRRSAPANITLNLATLGLSSAVTMHDLFPSMPLGEATGSFTAEVEPHGSLFLRLVPAQRGPAPGPRDDGWRPEPPPLAAERADGLRRSAAERWRAKKAAGQQMRRGTK